MLRVAIIQRLFPHYRKAVFDALAQEYELTLLHTNKDKGIAATKAPYAQAIKAVWYGRGDTHVYLKTAAALRETQPQVIIHELGIGILSLYKTMRYARKHQIPFILWGHGYDRVKGFDPAVNKTDKIRLWLYQKAKAVLLYGAQGKGMLQPYLDDQKLFVAPNTLDTPALANIRAQLEAEGKERVKARLGYTATYNLVFIGRLLDYKQPDWLIDLVVKLQEKNLDVHAHWIGDGPEMERLKAKAAPHPNWFHFHGSIYEQDQIGERLFAADLMVMPGDLGLSVNHAHHLGLPVVTLKTGENGPYHGPEGAYVISGETGYQASSYGDMLAFLEQYLTNHDKQQHMRKAVLHAAENVHALQQMVQGFRSVISYAKGGEE